MAFELKSADFPWQPRYSDLDTILRTAWDWHRSHPDGYGN